MATMKLLDKNGFELKVGDLVAYVEAYEVVVGKIQSLPEVVTALPKIYDVNDVTSNGLPYNPERHFPLNQIKRSDRYYIIVPEPAPIMIKKLKGTTSTPWPAVRSKELFSLEKDVLFADCL